MMSDQSTPLRRAIAPPSAALLGVLLAISGTTSGQAQQHNATYPVTVSSCGHSATFTKAPERVVTFDVNMIEDMIALGLEDRVVATFAVGDNTHPIGEAYRDVWNKLEHVSDQYPEFEPLIARAPDFVFGGWSWGLVEAKNITPQSLSGHGINTYILSESCDWGPGDPQGEATGMNTVYTDLANLGLIFGVSETANAVIQQMQDDIAAVEERVKGLPPKKVFLYDAGEAAPFTVGALGVPHDLITLAGGQNIFASLERSWTEATWEAVVEAQPDCIVLNDYGGSSASSSAEWKAEFLRSSPITRAIPAVVNNCILTVSFGGLAPGPRAVDTVKAIAQWLHPEAFQ